MNLFREVRISLFQIPKPQSWGNEQNGTGKETSDPYLSPNSIRVSFRNSPG